MENMVPPWLETIHFHLLCCLFPAPTLQLLVNYLKNPSDEQALSDLLTLIQNRTTLLGVTLPGVHQEPVQLIAELTTMDPFLKENAVTVMRHPAVLVNPLWKANLKIWTQKYKPAIPRPNSVVTAAKPTVPFNQSELETMLVASIQQQFKESTEQLNQHQRLRLKMLQNAEFKHTETSSWVYLGRRHAPNRSQNPVHMNEDGGLSHTNFMELIEIELVRQITKVSAENDSTFFSKSVDPLSIDPNSEIFLFKYGNLPLWEFQPQGSNIDVDFNEPEVARTAWVCLVTYFLKDWLWSTGICGFSFVKRFNGLLRMTLWVDHCEPVYEIASRHNLENMKILYRSNISRLVKHNMVPDQPPQGGPNKATVDNNMNIS